MQTRSPHSPLLTRRAILRTAGAACAIGAAPCMSANAQEPNAISVAQIVDLSSQHQDVSRDFFIGSRAAWTDFNARNSGRRTVRHVVLETDGSEQAVRKAWQTTQDDPSCVALSGCASDALAATVAMLQSNGAAMANVAPWLHRHWQDDSDTIFDIFPNYQAQISHAVRSLAVMGVQQAGAVFANSTLQQQLQESVNEAAKTEGLRLQALSVTDRQSAPPPMILFIGGTPELHDYISRLSLPQGRQCFVIALADVNLQVLAQLGGTPRNISVIATQPVPLVTNGLPVVRAYRDVMAKLYDEPPSPQGLAGFIAARYTAEIISSISGPVNRTSVLAAFRKRAEIRIGGYAVTYRGHRLSHAHVTQSMLTPDGRIVG